MRLADCTRPYFPGHEASTKKIMCHQPRLLRDCWVSDRLLELTARLIDWSRDQCRGVWCQISSAMLAPAPHAHIQMHTSPTRVLYNNAGANVCAVMATCAHDLLRMQPSLHAAYAVDSPGLATSVQASCGTNCVVTPKIFLGLFLAP